VSAYEQGDVVAVNFDPTMGHEPAKALPAVVVSGYDFNCGSSLTVIAPITSIDNGYPLHVMVAEGNDVSGFVCVEQLRPMDLVKCRAERLGAIDDTTMLAVMSCARGVFNV